MPVLQQLLEQAKYPQSEISFLIQGFNKGFDIGYQGPQDRQDEAPNIPLRVGSPTEMWNKLMKEVSLSRVAGPFTKQRFPFKNYVQSPIGLVPKAGGKTRLIFHLSCDFKADDPALHKSINFFTPDQLCSVKYNDLDVAVRQCIELITKTGVTQLFYSKSDCSSAFRLLPAKIGQCCWMTMKMKHPETGILFY